MGGMAITLTDTADVDTGTNAYVVIASNTINNNVLDSSSVKIIAICSVILAISCVMLCMFAIGVNYVSKVRSYKDIIENTMSSNNQARGGVSAHNYNQNDSMNEIMPLAGINLQNQNKNKHDSINERNIELQMISNTSVGDEFVQFDSNKDEKRLPSDENGIYGAGEDDIDGDDATSQGTQNKRNGEENH